MNYSCISGVFELCDRMYESSLDVIPLVGGHLPLPQVKLVKYQAFANGYYHPIDNIISILAIMNIIIDFVH